MTTPSPKSHSRVMTDPCMSATCCRLLSWGTVSVATYARCSPRSGAAFACAGAPCRQCIWQGGMQLRTEAVRARLPEHRPGRDTHLSRHECHGNEACKQVLACARCSSGNTKSSPAVLLQLAGRVRRQREAAHLPGPCGFSHIACASDGPQSPLHTHPGCISACCIAEERCGGRVATHRASTF